MVHSPKIPYSKKNPKPLLFILFIIPISLLHGLSLQNKKSPFTGEFLSDQHPDLN